MLLGVAVWMKRSKRWAPAAVLVVTLAWAPSAVATDAPHYDVPSGLKRCAHATAWNGFFKWASVRHSTCRYAGDFMRAYARAVPDDGVMPTRVRGFTCRIRYWKNEDGDVYASRHSCKRGRLVVRFYGMA
jgi:hypothetical protein